MAQLVKYRTVSGTSPRIPIQDVVLNMSKIISVDTDVRTGRGVLVYQNDVELSTIYTSEVASYTKTKLTGYVTALAVKYDVFEGKTDQYFIVDEIVYAIRHKDDPTNKTDIYITNGTDTLVNKVTIMASLETLIADANQVSFNGATWGEIGGTIGDQTDLQNQFSTKVDKTTTITINAVTYDLSANRSWTISGATWGGITGNIDDQDDLNTKFNNYVPKVTQLTINGQTYDLSADRSWTIPTTWGGITGTLSDQTDLQSVLNAKQATLVSGANIKSINGVSILGSGDMVVVDSVNSYTGVVVLDTDDISDAGAINKYVTAAEKTIIGNTSGTNSGDNATNTQYSGLAAAIDTLKPITITFIIDGGGSAITTGIKGDFEIPFACTINQVTMLADQSGSIVVDLWKDTYANYPPTVADTITAAAKPTISATNKSQDAALTGWTTSISAGDILRFNVDSITTLTRVTISLKVTRI